MECSKLEIQKLQPWSQQSKHGAEPLLTAGPNNLGSQQTITGSYAMYANVS